MYDRPDYEAFMRRTDALDGAGLERTEAAERMFVERTVNALDEEARQERIETAERYFDAIRQAHDDRDALWCQALLDTLDLRAVEAVLTAFNARIDYA